jgi:YjbE family integral membrane protein
MFEFSWSWKFLLDFLSIIVIDLALSGDNAIVIGMAAACLPRQRRKWAIVFGGGLAIVLRIVLTAIATLLLRIPLLTAIGGCVLFWVAWKLLRIDEDESGCEDKKKQANNFRQALILIVTADFMMSLDNVLAVAGTAHGDILLLILGLLFSMPLLMTTGGVISLLIDKFKWLVYLGAAVILFTGTRMIFEDKLLAPHIHLSHGLILGISAIVGIVLTLLFMWYHQRKANSIAAKKIKESDAPLKSPGIEPGERD